MAAKRSRQLYLFSLCVTANGHHSRKIFCVLVPSSMAVYMPSSVDAGVDALASSALLAAAFSLSLAALALLSAAVLLAAASVWAASAAVFASAAATASVAVWVCLAVTSSWIACISANFSSTPALVTLLAASPAVLAASLASAALCAAFFASVAVLFAASSAAFWAACAAAAAASRLWNSSVLSTALSSMAVFCTFRIRLQLFTTSPALLLNSTSQVALP